MDITIIPNENTNAPAGKLADAELIFTDGALEGLKLIGFSARAQTAKPHTKAVATRGKTPRHGFMQKKDKCMPTLLLT